MLFKNLSFLLSFINKYTTLITSFCIATTIGLSFLFYAYKWLTKITNSSPQHNNAFEYHSALTTAISKVYPQKRIKPSSLWWIQTNNDQLILLDTEKDLPECLLKYLLEEYRAQFWHYNSTKTPLKVGYSSSDLDLLKKALACINSDMENFKFTPEESATLLEISSTFKMQKLYMILLFSAIPNNDINTKQIMPILLNINEGFTTLFNNIMTKTINKKYNSKKFPFIGNQRYKITLGYLPAAYYFWDRQNHKYLLNNKGKEKKFSYNYNYKMFPHKKLVLFTWQINTYQDQKITPRIYDFENDKTYDLGINIIEVGQTAISPDEKYIAISSDYIYNTEHDGAIYLLDISNLKNITHYTLLHAKAYSLAFSPDSTMLASGTCTENSALELWNIKNLHTYTKETIKSRTLLRNIWYSRDIVFNKDNKHLVVTHQDMLTIVNIDDPTQNKTFNNIGLSYSIFKNNTDLIRYTESINNSHAIKIINKNGTTIFSLLCNNQYPRLTSYRISDNEKQIAIHSSIIPLHLLTIKNENKTEIKPTGTTHRCEMVNNDGSFWIRTEKTLKFYNPQLQCLINLKCDKDIESVEFSDNKQHIICNHFRFGRETYWQLPSPNDIHQIKNILDRMTPLQYLLIKKVCNQPKTDNTSISLQKNSLDHHILQSFGQHTKLVTDIFKLQITDK